MGRTTNIHWINELKRNIALVAENIYVIFTPDIFKWIPFLRSNKWHIFIQCFERDYCSNAKSHSSTVILSCGLCHLLAARPIYMSDMQKMKNDQVNQQEWSPSIHTFAFPYSLDFFISFSNSGWQVLSSYCIILIKWISNLSLIIRSNECEVTTQVLLWLAVCVRTVTRPSAHSPTWAQSYLFRWFIVFLLFWLFVLWPIAHVFMLRCVVLCCVLC